MTTTTRALAAIAAKLALGTTLALGLMAPHTVHTANAEPACLAGQEDQPCWSCVDDGNRICGPGNAQGAPAGCYDEGGVLVTAWPCTGKRGADDPIGRQQSVDIRTGGH
jgi:hypothetical protein